ncbi:DNRLRE domain-containing protein [Candidatus Neomarinimicrobiota bacterium]
MGKKTDVLSQVLSNLRILNQKEKTTMHNDNRIGWKLMAGVLILSLSGLIAEEFPVVADTYIYKNSAFENFGGTEYLYIRQVSAPTIDETGGEEKYNRHGYLKFDISSYTGSIDTARLYLSIRRATSTENINPVTADFWLLDDGDDGWEESAMNWLNAPANWDSTSWSLVWANTPGTFVFDTVFDFHDDGSDSTYVFDVTDAVAADANGIISFFIADTSHNSGKLYIHSKENIAGAAAAMLEVKEAVTTAVDSKSTTPSAFSLHQNYPNPFNPETSIGYTLNRDTDVTITVYDLLGKEVTTLISGHVAAGDHSVVWNGTDENNQAVPSGVYFCKMAGDGQVNMIKMVLMK